MPSYSVIDIFCGVGGLSHGFVLEEFDVIAGIDSDPTCKYVYEKNNDAEFLNADVAQLTGDEIEKLYHEETIKILVGCAPCQPFSSYTNKLREKNIKQWSLLSEFGRLVEEVQPDIVSMENVPSIGSKDIFRDFVKLLKRNEYFVSWSNVFCPRYGVPQQRTRLVLLASKLGAIDIIKPTHNPDEYVTVQEAIGFLPPIEAGETHESDPLHRAGSISDMNIKRIRNSVPGGTWEDWDESLRANCHRKESGKSYYNVYGRMEWGKVSPTITTKFSGFGNGRFGHPQQDRALTLREGALLQTFPTNYEFFEPGSEYYFSHIVKHIGNAVPVLLARVIARSIRTHLIEFER